ncbi:MAG: hypothetical protein GY859_08055, partial [Desulfobacterales bacterium]|nr:hypothetical protein [Desulfobacterales bacterium]
MSGDDPLNRRHTGLKTGEESEGSAFAWHGVAVFAGRRLVKGVRRGRVSKSSPPMAYPPGIVPGAARFPG